MKTRKIGNTGIIVSELGYGTWGLGGNVKGAVAYGPVDDAESIRALTRAFDLGITFYDTADFYGFGHSESILGKALGTVRDSIIIASKVGLIDLTGKQDFSPAYMKKSLEQSLQRLNTDHLDLYQLHSPPLQTLVDQFNDIVSTLESLKNEGKIRLYGVSLRKTEDGVRVIGDLGFKIVQVNLNMMDQRPVNNGLFQHCIEKCTGVIARTPLSFGFLSGMDTKSFEKFNAYDHRSKRSAEQIERWKHARDLFVPILEKYKPQTMAQVALRYCLSHSAVSTVIPGMMTTAEVEENAAASNYGPLDSSDLGKIAEIYRQNEFFLGKSA
ncbi:MAG: aldo/keto reductase [Kiritimatiellae bacterium]|nr:aldo/keto reductase [Kiritimatiellia bacterium]MDD5521302.1 aldo/keto reductase [Kiritimatiellia bacterium]